MSTTTATFGSTIAATPAATRANPRKSFYERLIAWQQRRSDAQVGEAFARMADNQLADIGFNPDQIHEVRATGRVPMSYWG